MEEVRLVVTECTPLTKYSENVCHKGEILNFQAGKIIPEYFYSQHITLIIKKISQFWLRIYSVNNSRWIFRSHIFGVPHDFFFFELWNIVSCANIFSRKLTSAEQMGRGCLFRRFGKYFGLMENMHVTQKQKYRSKFRKTD